MSSVEVLRYRSQVEDLKKTLAQVVGDLVSYNEDHVNGISLAFRATEDQKLRFTLENTKLTCVVVEKFTRSIVHVNFGEVGNAQTLARHSRLHQLMDPRGETLSFGPWCQALWHALGASDMVCHIVNMDVDALLDAEALWGALRDFDVSFVIDALRQLQSLQQMAVDPRSALYWHAVPYMRSITDREHYQFFPAPTINTWLSLVEKNDQVDRQLLSTWCPSYDTEGLFVPPSVVSSFVTRLASFTRPWEASVLNFVFFWSTAITITIHARVPACQMALRLLLTKTKARIASRGSQWNTHPPDIFKTCCQLYHALTPSIMNMLCNPLLYPLTHWYGNETFGKFIANASKHLKELGREGDLYSEHTLTVAYEGVWTELHERVAEWVLPQIHDRQRNLLQVFTDKQKAFLKGLCFVSQSIQHVDECADHVETLVRGKRFQVKDVLESLLSEHVTALMTGIPMADSVQDAVNGLMMLPDINNVVETLKSVQATSWSVSDQNVEIIGNVLVHMSGLVNQLKTAVKPVELRPDQSAALNALTLDQQQFLQSLKFVYGERNSANFQNFSESLNTYFEGADMDVVGKMDDIVGSLFIDDLWDRLDALLMSITPADNVQSALTFFFSFPPSKVESTLKALNSADGEQHTFNRIVKAIFDTLTLAHKLKLADSISSNTTSFTSM